MNYKITVIACVLFASYQSKTCGFFDFITYPYYAIKHSLENLQKPQEKLPESPVEVAQKTIAIKKEMARWQIERKLNKCLVNNELAEKNADGFPLVCKDFIDEFTLLAGLEEREILRKAYTNQL